MRDVPAGCDGCSGFSADMIGYPLTAVGGYFVLYAQAETERKFQNWTKCAGGMLRKYEVCATLLFDLKLGSLYNVCIELVGNIGDDEGIFQQIPFYFFDFVCGFGTCRSDRRGVRKKKEEQT